MLYKNFQSVENYKSLFVVENAEIDYSDGEVEKHILEKITNSQNSTFSTLEEHIVDWPTEYHFSWVRANILEPIKFDKTQRVLELGGGTGLLTNYIAPKVRQIVSIEGSLQRAKCISKRCEHHDNVEILVSNFEKADLVNTFGEKSFDVITLIGVLEYSNKYSELDNGINNILSICNKLLKPNGQLIIAIENKLGLKYLLGFEEDHLGIPYYGVENRYKKNDVITFSHSELVQILEKANFTVQETFLPFPDYKLPKVIINGTDLTIDTDEINLITNLLSSDNFKNYSNKPRPEARESRILQNIVLNGFLKELSNSFLLVAEPNKRNQVKKKKTNSIAYYFSTSRRYEFANKISFNKDIENKKILFTKEKISTKSNNSALLELNSKSYGQGQIARGILLSSILEDAFIKNDRDKFNRFLNFWISILKQDSLNVDLMPFNIIVDDETNYNIIDHNEWLYKYELSVEFLVIKYLQDHPHYFKWLLNFVPSTLDQYNQMLNSLNLNSISNEDLNKLAELTKYITENIIKAPYTQVKSSLTFKSLLKLCVPPILLKLYERVRT